jgi:hypothetical protein
VNEWCWWYGVSADGLWRVVTPKARLARNSQLCFVKTLPAPGPRHKTIVESAAATVKK